MAMTQLLFFLLFVGVMGQQRLIHLKGMNWAKAQAYCRQHHTDLVTIRSDSENKQIKKNSWLGLYRDASSSNWKWSKGDEPLTFSNKWTGGSPQTGNCVYKHADDKGAWRTEDCGSKQDFYCVDANFVAKTLKLVWEKKTWEEALEHCRSLEVIDPTVYQNHSYDLVTLVTQEEHDTARNMTQHASTDGVWTGLRFLGDQWMWVDGEEVQYVDIDKCPTDQRCGLLEKTGTSLYNLSTCQEKNNFFCYKRAPAEN